MSTKLDTGPTASNTAPDRVADVQVRVVTTRYEGGLRNSLHPWSEKSAVLAFLRTEQGVTGVGEAWCDSGTPESVARIIERDLAPRIVGRVLWGIDAAWQAMEATNLMSAKSGALYAAMSAIDIASWDALARSVGLPLHQLLGGYANRVEVYASGGMYGPDYTPTCLADDMAAAVRDGFAGVKIKAGGASPAEDVARISAVRAAIGPSARLMVDILFSQDLPAAMRLAKAVVGFDLHFLEAPTRRDDMAGWAEIRTHTGVPLAGPELECSLPVLRDALAMRAVDYLQVDATICGGITQVRRAAAVAAAYHRKTTLHCSGSAVALAANAQVAASICGCDGLEMHLMHRTLFEHLWAAGYRIADGMLLLPPSPGLGIEIGPDDAGMQKP